MSDGSIDRELGSAFQAYRTGDLQLATRIVEAVLKSHPGRADARMAKGQILLAKGDEVQALEWFAASLEVKARNPEALNTAIVLCLNQRRFLQAEGYARQLVQIQPSSHRTHYLLGVSLRGLDRVEEALAAIDKALQLKPDDLESLVAKARLLKTAQFSGLAADVYRRVLTFGPYPPAAIGLAEILLRDSHPEAALELLNEAAVRLEPAQRPHALIAQAYTELQQFDEADRQWALAETNAGEPGSVIVRRARSEIAAGRFHDAEQRLREALDQGVQPSACFAVLSTARKLTGDDLPLIEKMEAVWKSGNLRDSERIQLAYALGKGRDDLGDYGQAMAYFDEGNRLSFETSTKRKCFNAADAKRSADFQIQYFTAQRVRELAQQGDESSLSLFVVGMMRSGTTLTEQILSSHTRVKGGGEQAFWTERAAEFIDWHSGAFDSKLARRMAPQYLALIDPGQSGIDYVVDKNPGNTPLSAVLHGIFPNSKFVHVKRHPVDNLLSMWMTPVNDSVDYSCDRNNLIAVYRQYVRLESHFVAVIPPDRFRTFTYEELTSTPEVATRAMLGHLGLDMEAACLSPEKNRRTVLTPSVYQVRQPIHRNSQERWKRYEPWLGAFAKLLEAD